MARLGGQELASLVIWQRAEGALVFLSSIALFVYLGSEWSWWLVVLIFFAPDVSFVAYLLGPKVGAFGYNIAHVYALGAILLALGLSMELATAPLLGALWLAHSGFDRMLGYGLKSPEGFTKTHLGTIGPASADEP